MGLYLAVMNIYVTDFCFHDVRKPRNDKTKKKFNNTKEYAEVNHVIRSNNS